MKTVILSLILMTTCALGAAAGVLRDKFEAIVAIEGVTGIDGTAEAREETDAVELVTVAMLPDGAADTVCSHLQGLPDEMVEIDINTENLTMKMWAEPDGDVNADIVIFMAANGQKMVIFIRGDLREIRNHINID